MKQSARDDLRSDRLAVQVSAACEHCASCPVRAQMLKVLTSDAPKRPRETRDQKAWSAATRVLELAEELFGYDRIEFLRPFGQGSIKDARAVAMYVARDMTDASFPVLGDVFDRDHTTVMYACRRVGERLDESRGIAAMVAQLKERVLVDRHEGAA